MIDAVVAVDAATGRVRWTSPADLRANAGVLFTDGRVLVTDELTPRAHLQAFDPANGEPRWSSDLPAPVDNLVEVHALLPGRPSLPTSRTGETCPNDPLCGRMNLGPRAMTPQVQDTRSAGPRSVSAATL